MARSVGDQLNEEFVPDYLRGYMHHSQSDFWISRCFDPVFIAHIMYAGFLPIATSQGKQFYLLPKLHEQRCVVDPRTLHIPKTIRKKSKRYRLTINHSFDHVVKGCHEQHGEAWLYPPVVDAFRILLSGVMVEKTLVKIVSVELWNDKSIVAGELGYCNGAMYTSLTGYVSKEASGAGTMQLYALGVHLHRCGYQLWDLGMSMEYKLRMGARDIPRTEFVSFIHTLRDKEVGFLEEETPVDILINQYMKIIQ